MGCAGSKPAKWDKPNPIATFDCTMGTFKAESEPRPSLCDYCAAET